jgi:hypothetical protein
MPSADQRRHGFQAQVKAAPLRVHEKINSQF